MRKLFRDCTGSALLVAAGGLPILVGAAGLATDTVQWTLWKRQIQRQADSAALAGAYARAQSMNVQASATADITRNTSAGVPLSATPVIENAPTTGPFAGDAQAVRVVLRTQRRLPFSSLFMTAQPQIVAEATAALVSQGTYCMLALEHTTAAGITMQGNATINLGCGMATNSKSNNAVVAGGSSTITATPVAAVGGLQASNNFLSPTTLLPYTVTQRDPYAGLPLPAASGCAGPVNVGPNSTRTIDPGCYRGMDIKGTVTLNPGVYYIDGSSLDFGSQAVVTGTGVTIILTSSSVVTNPDTVATVNMNGGATVNLTAGTDAPYAGILFYQDPRALDSGTNLFNGNSASTYAGAIYVPRQQVDFNGTSGMNTTCLQFVARRIGFSGNATISNVCPAGYGGGGFLGTRVRLVD